MSFPSSDHRRWHEDALVQLACVRGLPVGIEKAEIKATIYFPNRIRADLSNKFESIGDLLVDAGIIKDDKWECVPRIEIVSGGVDTKNPRAEVEITELK